MGARIKNITTQQTVFSPTLKLLVDKPDTGSGDWLQARAMELALLGNTYMQGSNNGTNWHDNIISSDTYFRFSTDGGTTWKNLDADSIQEGVTNKFYTETKVSANTDVAANTAARHSHSNKSILDSIIDSGTGHNFLADDGTYKNFDSDPIFVIHTTYNITNGTGFLKNNGTGTWSYDSSTYLTTTTAASTYQPLDGDLTAIAGLTGTTGFLKKTNTNTWTLDTNTYLTGTKADSFNTRTGAVTLTKTDVEGVLTGTITSHDHSGVYQPVDADLTAIAALTGTTGFLKKTASNTWTLDTNTYLTSETDPVVGAITGIIKANGAGAISAASAGTDYEVPITFSTGLSRATNTVTVAYGTTSTTACVGNDSRLSDARTPTDNSVTEAKLASAYKNMEAISGTVLDWANMGGTKTLSADTTFTFSNLRKGAYFLETSGDYSPTFPTGFNYAGGTRAATGTTLYQIVCTNATTPIGWYIILKTES